MLTTSCGSLAVKPVKRPFRVASALPSHTTCWVACASSSSEWPPWSCSTYSKPPKTPRPCTTGGRNGMAMAPVTAPSLPQTCWMTAWADWSARGRSEYGWRPKNIMPRLGARPEKLKPLTENTVSTSGISERSDCTCSATRAVWASDAPSGAWRSIMPQPWSSSGTKARGTCWYTKYVRPRPARNSATASRRWPRKRVRPFT